jgi:uncharacterized protein YfaS (alpha-2-macroglobulin family)
MKRSVFLAGASVLVATTIAVLTSRSLAQPSKTISVSAAYVHGALRVSIPYRAPQTGEGRLLVEVLDPENRSVASIAGHADASAGQGFWTRELVLPKNLPFDELVWHRLRYRFTYANEKAAPLEGVISISRILRFPVVHVLGQQSYLSGGAAAVRLIVNEADNETSVTSGSVQIELIQPAKKNQVLFAGALNEHGTTPVQFHFPTSLAGHYSLRYAIDTSLGPVEHIEDIQLEDKSSILLTTEKPVYQPGQTIHIRALALDRANHQAVAGRRLTLEIDDSRGNKVFRKISQTDPYGLASTEFVLADEVNLGAYHLRALLDGAGASSSEITLQVDRYVLPRFKVAVDLLGKEKAKRGYRPGDHVTGTVRANYFFGKPVEGEVTVKASGFDVTRFDAGNSTGKLDGEGAFQFDLRLPDFFAGRSASQGAARVLIEATVKDTSGHSESRGEPVAVSESPLLITVVPESGSLVPGLENRVYVLTSYPDGTPAQSEIRAEASGNGVQTVETDKGGVAIVPMPGGGTILRVKAKDREGNHASARVELESRATGSDQVLLRAERAVYRAGDPIRLDVLTTKQSGCVYVDVVKNGQAIGTHDLTVANGRATLELTATPDMTGTIEIHAYLFGSDATVTGDRRMLFVQPADELRIETSLDAPVYKPGSEARIGFRVTNSRGQGVQAALGVEIVDQAVFALAEKQPGFAKVFFFLEQEALKPRYEIHSITLDDAVTSTESAESVRRDRAAQVLFAAAQAVSHDNAPTEFGRTVPQDKYQQFASRYLARLRAQIDEIAAESNGDSQMCDQTLLAGNLRKANFHDAWGNDLRLNRNWRGVQVFEVRSAGPDGQFYTPDDLIQYRDERHCVPAAFQPTGRGIELRIEPTGKAGSGITGTVTDPSGAVVPRATIKLVDRVNGKVHTLASDADGRFALAGLAAGSFEILVTSPGFRASARQFSFAEGERAVFSVVLEVGAVTQTVEVMAAPASLQTESSMFAMAPPLRAVRKAKETVAATLPGTSPDTHVRSWFPEALYVAPEIITDNHGRASITIPIADNITTWRMAMMASTRLGSLGSGASSLKVFQDFFTELDLPVTLTQGDQVSLPVAVYNYSGKRGEVRLKLTPDDWFSLTGDVPEKSLFVENERVGGSQFTIEAKRIGKFKLTLKAELEGPAKRADIVIREIEVVPNGRQQTVAFNGRVEGSVEHAVAFPANAIPDAGKIFVRLYPGPLSQVVEGMDAILRMPYGCFEQTSSATYPNILALGYMKRTKKLTPEVHAKAEGLIASGYQRLLTFEVHGGGFSWFGQAPANKILTSYGLMEFADMAKVHDVDARVISRTQQWLASQQQSDGSWKPDTTFINEGATNRYNSDVLRITAYIAWALQNSGYRGPEIERARQFISQRLTGAQDAYTLAVLANFAADYQQDRALTRQVVQQLVDARTEKDDQSWWTTAETAVYGRGESAAIETTGLILQALPKSGEAPAVTRKALNYLAARKDAAGTWGTTQATIMALRALLLSMEKASAEARGTVEITLNGKPAGRLALTQENGDLFHQFVFKNIDFNGSNQVGIRFQGEGNPAYQIAGEYFVPWTATTVDEPLSIAMSYDRTRLSQGDLASATATVRNRLPKTANMVMVDLGIPPGFDLLPEDLDDYRNRSAGRKSGRLEKFNMTATHAILYFDSIGAGETITLHYRLRAKYPIRTRTFQSRVYEYYEPEVKSVARPVEMEIRKR